MQFVNVQQKVNYIILPERDVRTSQSLYYLLTSKEFAHCFIQQQHVSSFQMAFERYRKKVFYLIP